VPLLPRGVKPPRTKAVTGHRTPKSDLHREYIVPSVFDKRVAEAVANGVEEAVYQTRAARRDRTAQEEM